MALGFTSHFKSPEQQFGSLILGNIENETAGSIAHGDSIPLMGLLVSGDGDLCDFSVSVDIDYSQYANFICAESGATETAGSVAYAGGSFSTATTVTSYSGGGCSFSSGGGGGASPAAYTC